MSKINIFWHRRDLRIADNKGLFHALTEGHPVLPLFIFDSNILDTLENPRDARVEFIYDQILDLNRQLTEIGSAMLVRHGDPLRIWEKLTDRFSIHAVFTNRDYEPYAKERDDAVKELLENKGIAFHTYKDHVIFEKDEVCKDDGSPYTVFTPYSRKWKARLGQETIEEEDVDGRTIKMPAALQPFPGESHADRFYSTKPFEIPSLESMGFQRTGMIFPSKTVNQGLIKNYDKTRDIPAIRGTSRLGIHFRFGTISIREKARRALELNGVFLNELIWRDFYAMILDAFPRVVRESFKPQYDRIEWRNDEWAFKQWCEGKTGYPIVDAGMRELNATGYMHNRVRMITASFLTKHLLIDWRWGEAYFAQKLLDYDLASNNGGWQWAAGSGTDAAPYFRIFNPSAQQQKFDKDLKYIRQWVPEYGAPGYPKPIVDHAFARERCLEAYKRGLSGGG